MKAIKKVEVVPLDYNEGKIINSWNTTDDKTKNAPSMEIVKNSCVFKDDYAIITGSVEISEGDGTNYTTTTKNIDYPTGFDNTNCVCISIGCSSSQSIQVYDNGRCLVASSELVAGNFPRSLLLNSQHIQLRFSNNTTSTINTYYKIVLMKIS